MALEDYSEYNHSVRIWKVIPPFLILFGTVGNFLTIVVLSRRRSRNSSTAVYLCALAMSDIVVLNTGLLRQWLTYLIEFDVRHLQVGVCKVHVFLVYTGTQASSWFLVAVTSERFLGVWLPHKVRQGCTPRSALLVTLVITLVLMVLNSHWFYGIDHVTVTYEDNVTVVEKCVAIDEEFYTMFRTFTWPWIDLCVFCIIPFFILLVGNVSIILKVMWSERRTRKQVMPFQAAKKKTDDKTSQLTAILMTLNIVFFINIAPISVFLVSEPFWMHTVITEQQNALYYLFWAIVNMFMYLNNAINFVLYFLSGSRFRAEVRTVLCGGEGRAVFGNNSSKVGTAVSKPTMQTTDNTTSSERNRTTTVHTIGSDNTQSKESTL